MVVGDVTNSDSLQGLVSGSDVIIHLVAIIKENRKRGITFEGINFEATNNIVNAAVEQGVNRFLHISALGADPQGSTPYFRTKGRAEALVKASSLNYSIFRPSFIYGPGDAVYSMLAKIIRVMPFGIMPVFGAGNYRHQPVHVESLTTGIVNSISEKQAFHNTYDVGGLEAISYRDQLTAIGNTVGKRVRHLQIPLWISKIAVYLFGRFRFVPIDSDTLTMLTSENICDPKPFSQELNSPLESFETGLKYLYN